MSALSEVDLRDWDCAFAKHVINTTPEIYPHHKDYFFRYFEMLELLRQEQIKRVPAILRKGEE